MIRHAGYGMQIRSRRSDQLDIDALRFVESVPGATAIDLGCGEGGSPSRWRSRELS